MNNPENGRYTLFSIGSILFQRVSLCRAFALAVLSTLFVPCASLADSDDSRALLVEELTALGSLSTDVRQLVMASSGSVLEESQIRFYLKRPDGFYWETLSPYPELIVTDGTTLWNFQPDLFQVTIDDWDASQSELAAQLLSGQGAQALAEYEVTHQAIQSGGTEYYLDPLDPASLYEEVTLFFDQQGLASLLLVSTNGQRTFWEFSNREFNTTIADSQFQFSVPDDEMLDVLDRRSATQAN